MTDLDERFPAFRERNMDDIVFREECAVCGAWITLTRSEELELLRQLPKDLPANRVTVTCKCNKYQIIFGARFVT